MKIICENWYINKARREGWGGGGGAMGASESDYCEKKYQIIKMNKERELVYLCFDYLYLIWSFGLKVHHL